MTYKDETLPDLQKVDAVAIVDSQGRTLTLGSVTESSGLYTFDPSSLPKAYTYDANSNPATITYGPDRNGRSYKITKTWNGGLLQTESAPLLVGTAATGLAITGAATGTVGEPSDAITVAVTPAGGYFSPFTFTPSDGGAGGQFEPASADLSFGAASASFVYTPAADGPLTITGKASQGFAQPAALAFVSAAKGKAQAPTIGALTLSGNDVTAHWTQLPVHVGGLPVLGYLVVLSNGERLPAPVFASSLTFYALPSGVPVTASVAAITLLGVGDFSLPSNSVTPGGSTPVVSSPSAQTVNGFSVNSH
jgi:hypothetical protein